MGRVIHLLDENQRKEFYTEKIGLGTFLRVTGMYGVRLSKILDLPVDIKMRIRDQFSEALKNEQMIIPIMRNVYREREKLEMGDIAR